MFSVIHHALKSSFCRALPLFSSLISTSIRTLHASPIPTLLHASTSSSITHSASASSSSPSLIAAIGKGLGISALSIVSLNLIGFTITAATRTHLITDLIGTGAFVVATFATFSTGKAWSNNRVALRPALMTVCSILWGVRLAGYLFYRILQTKHDSRLASFFPSSSTEPWTGNKLFKLALFWTVQATWAFIVLLPVTVVNSLPHSWHIAHPVGLPAMFGLVLFSASFCLETYADFQKYTFRSNPSNDGLFLSTGAYSLCRFPNYAGEIGVWWAMYCLALPAAMTKHAFWIVLSPVFITVLLRYVSGIPLLEKRYDEQYKDNPEYQQYKKMTSLLIPMMPRLKQIEPSSSPTAESEGTETGNNTEES